MVSYLPRYCTNCGASNQHQAAFCFACGQSLQAQVDTTSTTSATLGSLAPGQLLKERYRIVAQIGKGGMGTVYKAEDTLFDDHFVAVKELSQSGLNAQEMVEATTAFKREARLLVGLNHPNLPKIIDYFADAGRWYLVMDFIEGETLETYLTHRAGGYLPVNEALDRAGLPAHAPTPDYFPRSQTSQCDAHACWSTLLDRLWHCAPLSAWTSQRYDSAWLTGVRCARTVW